MATEEEAKILTESTTYKVSSSSKYMGMRQTKITVHGLLVDISGDRLGAFFAQYSLMDEVIATISNSGIATLRPTATHVVLRDMS